MLGERKWGWKLRKDINHTLICMTEIQKKKKKKKTPYAHKGRIASSKLFVQNELEETNQPQM